MFSGISQNREKPSGKLAGENTIQAKATQYE